MANVLTWRRGDATTFTENSLVAMARMEQAGWTLVERRRADGRVMEWTVGSALGWLMGV